MRSLCFFSLFIFFMNLVSEIIFPLNFSMHKLLFESVVFLSSSFRIFLASFGELIKFFVQMSMVYNELIQLFLDLIFTSV